MFAICSSIRKSETKAKNESVGVEEKLIRQDSIIRKRELFGTCEEKREKEKGEGFMDG